MEDKLEWKKIGMVKVPWMIKIRKLALLSYYRYWITEPFISKL